MRMEFTLEKSTASYERYVSESETSTDGEGDVSGGQQRKPTHSSPMRPTSISSSGTANWGAAKDGVTTPSSSPPVAEVEEEPPADESSRKSPAGHPLPLPPHPLPNDSWIFSRLAASWSRSSDNNSKKSSRTSSTTASTSTSSSNGGIVGGHQHQRAISAGGGGSRSSRHRQRRGAGGGTLWKDIQEGEGPRGDEDGHGDGRSFVGLTRWERVCVSRQEDTVQRTPVLTFQLYPAKAYSSIDIGALSCESNRVNPTLL